MIVNLVQIYSHGKFTRSARNGEMLQHYFYMIRKSLLSKLEIFESSMIVSYNPLESCIYSGMDRAPDDTVPHFDRDRLLLYPSDVYYDGMN